MKRCEQITLDYEKSQFQKLSVKDRIQLGVHMSLCAKCRRFVKDSQKMDLWLKRRFEMAEPEVHFSEAEKESLKEKLR